MKIPKVSLREARARTAKHSDLRGQHEQGTRGAPLVLSLLLSGLAGCSSDVETPAPHPARTLEQKVVTTDRGTRIHGRQYLYEVVGMSGKDSIVSINPTAGINDRGQIAFVGKRSSGADNIFFGRAGQAPVSVTPSAVPSRRYSDGLQINNTPKIVCQDSLTGVTALRLWDPTQPGVSTTVAQGQTTASAPSSTVRCFETAWMLTSYGSASWLTVASETASRATMSRRVGSASAANTLDS